MRTGTPSELQLATPTRVGLAQGQAHMHVNAQGTLLTDQLVQPICSLGLLVKECRYKVSWDDQRFELRGPNGERIETKLRGDCPVVSESLGLAMIKEIEDKRHARALRQLYLRVVRQKATEVEESSELRVAGVTLIEMLEWLNREAGDLGESVLSQVPPESFQVEHHSLVLNRRKRRAWDRAAGIVVHLFAGHITGRSLLALQGLKSVTHSEAREHLPGEEKLWQWLNGQHTVLRPSRDEALKHHCEQLSLMALNSQAQTETLNSTPQESSPLRPGDQMRYLLVATLSVPWFEGGKLVDLTKGDSHSDHLIPPDGEDEMFLADGMLDGLGGEVEGVPGEEAAGVDLGEVFTIDADGEEGPEDSVGTVKAGKKAEEHEAFWRKECEPVISIVPTHYLETVVRMVSQSE
ncbi:GIP [Symbiodinium necroappetens]|uniref:GIP protein n=1 Tax=Symbiodinium necroappetens TaxID=1628268 RepID=A0A812Y387_9DINO|nr:GIP [Symbiodinium necroappetens]